MKEGFIVVNRHHALALCFDEMQYPASGILLQHDYATIFEEEAEAEEAIARTINYMETTHCALSRLADIDSLVKLGDWAERRYFRILPLVLSSDRETPLRIEREVAAAYDDEEDEA